MKTEIDWSKAPEGATHAMTTGPKWGGDSHIVGSVEYAKLEDGRYRCCGSDDIFVIGAKSWVVLAERPLPCDSAPLSDAVAAAWSGEGLPPVGAVCEVDIEGWHICEVIAHFQQRCGMVAAFTIDRGDGAKILDSYGEGCFRPIPSPEQIAAEEREKVIREMRELFVRSTGDVGGRIAALYDHGYRKQVKP